jgi:hypothetical protein
VKRALIILAVIAIGCVARAQDNLKLWTPPETLTFDTLRAWYASGGLPGQRWPRERYLDLNGDGHPEVFLGIEDYSRGMGYVLFTHRPEGSILIADRIEGAKAPFVLLAESHDRWRDFRTSLETWRERGLLEITYTWDGQHYVRKSEREIKSDEVSNP